MELNTISISPKELAEEFEAQFACLGENSKKYNKNGKKIPKTICQRLNVIESRRFIASSLSNLLKILLKEYSKFKYGQEKNVTLAELKMEIMSVLLKTQGLKMS